VTVADESRLALPATLDSLARVRAFAREAAARAGVDPRRTYGLALALDEIATNIVNYGYGPSHPGATIGLRAEIAGGMLRVTLDDAGTTFDPRTRKPPTEEELRRPLEERGVGGLGIFLAIQGVDRFDYRRAGDRNESVFEVRTGAGT
jgi:anti-sigma regulatory factor (Ser/Thr protein kinase)